MRLSIISSCAAIVAGVVGPVSADTIIVDPMGAGDATTIGAGLALAAFGDVVQVRPGIYDEPHTIATPVGDRTVQVSLPNGIELVSSDGPEVTIIGMSPTQYGVWTQPGAGMSTHLVGFTIKGSLAGIGTYQASPVVRGNILVDNGNEGILVNAGSPYIVENTIVGAEDFGIRMLLSAAPVVERNIVANGLGWGIRCESSSATVVRCNDAFGNVTNFGGCDLEGSNFSLDPEFCSTGDYRIALSSPCAAANSPETCGRIGALDPGCVSVPVHVVTWGSVKSEFR